MFKLTVKWLQNRENITWLAISFFSALTSLLFIAREVEQIEFLAIFTSTKIYVLYLAIILGYFSLLYQLLGKGTNWFTLSRKTLLVFFPTVAIWFYGFNESRHFNGSFYLAAFFYCIYGCFYFLFKYKNYSNISAFLKDWKTTKSSPPEKSTKNILPFFIVFMVIFINLFFGGMYLTKYAAVDEPLWTHGRISKFWNNVQEGEFERTMISDKPGITVALLSGAGLIFINPQDYKNPSWEGIPLDYLKNIQEMYLAFRGPIFLFNALMLISFYILLKKLFPSTIALIAIIFIGLSPLLLGISTIVNPDSLIWVFTPLSFISYLIYLKENRNKYLYLSGIFLGLAILTKYIANILYIFFFGLIFLEYIIHQSRYKNISISQYFRKAFLDYLVLIFFSLLVFFLFLPKVWVEPKTLFEGTIYSKAFLKVWPIFLGIIGAILLDMIIWKNKVTATILRFLATWRSFIILFFSASFLFFILFTLVNVYWDMKFYDLESILASPKSSYLFSNMFGLMIANFYSLIFGIIPIAFFAVMFLLAKLSGNRKFLKEDNASWSFYLIIFIILYYIASTINNVSATVRYQIILYPFILILAAVGIYEFINLKTIKRFFIPSYIYLVLFIFSVASLNFIRPFYFSYASDLLPRQYVLNLKDMGDGSYEAAMYLNSLPNAQNLVIWTDKRGVCSFFIGSCHSGMGLEKGKIYFDYFVVSSGREKRTTTMTLARFNGGNDKILRLDKLYSEESPEYKVEIGERPNNFVKVINANDIDYN